MARSVISTRHQAVPTPRAFRRARLAAVGIGAGLRAQLERRVGEAGPNAVGDLIGCANVTSSPRPSASDSAACRWRVETIARPRRARRRVPRVRSGSRYGARAPGPTASFRHRTNAGAGSST